MTAVVVVAVRFGPVLYRRYRVSVAAEDRRVAELAARADDQDRQVMAGDGRGVYGEYPPAG